MTIKTAERGKKRAVLAYVVDNARQAFERYRQRYQTKQQTHLFFQTLFDLPQKPRRIEVYDNSHTSGGKPVGVMIVADEQDFVKSGYRQFHIGKHVTDRQAGESYQTADDYSMLREVLQRRFAHEQDALPDVIIIDGGIGQLTTACDVLRQLGKESLAIMAMAKGRERKAGKETFYLPDGRAFMLRQDDAVAHYVQRLRDEAHRFAIMAHRKRRTRSMTQSYLDRIKGVGAQRKKALLHYFGSVATIKDAAIADLKKVEGINDSMARMIYDSLHEQDDNKDMPNKPSRPS